MNEQAMEAAARDESDDWERRTNTAIACRGDRWVRWDD